MPDWAQAPEVTNLLKWFSYDHHRPGVKVIAKRFSDLAHGMAEELEGPELIAGLRKLLEAKDCMIRAALTQFL